MCQKCAIGLHTYHLICPIPTNKWHSRDNGHDQQCQVLFQWCSRLTLIFSAMRWEQEGPLQHPCLFSWTWHSPHPPHTGLWSCSKSIHTSSPGAAMTDLKSEHVLTAVTFIPSGILLPVVHCEFYTFLINILMRVCYTFFAFLKNHLVKFKSLKYAKFFIALSCDIFSS